jgi:hypothetical protein
MKIVLLFAVLISCSAPPRRGPYCQAFVAGHLRFCSTRQSEAVCQAQASDQVVGKGEEACLQAIEATGAALFRATGENPWLAK